MLQLAILVLAQGASNTQEAPDTGAGIGLILGTLVAIVILVGLVVLVVSKRAKASRGGVEPAGDSREAGSPPFESIDRDR